MADLRFSVRALDSLEHQRAHLSQHNPRAANAVLDDVRRSCDLIADFPMIGRTIEGTRLRYLL